MQWGGGHKKLLVFGIFFNLALLGFYKYTDFILENLNIFFHSSIALPEILLPLALSFITFQQIGFLIDCKENKEILKIDILDYLLFITFFPQLIAGPIVHHKEMMPQFHSLLQKCQTLIDWEKFAKGLFIFSIGLFKKVVIADTFATWANAGFDATKNGSVLNLFESWATSLSYTFQLYFDFSGYCDMAIGLALFFGILLPINFNSPYKALNIQEFWKRWHITLGRFLTQYLYIPLGGSLLGKRRTLFNLMIVFILSGIWHGAGWGFILWGALHGGAMVVHRIYGYALQGLSQSYGEVIHKIKNHLGYKIIAWLITFNFINLSWVFFRSENLSGAINLIQGMFGGSGVVLPSALEGIAHKLHWGIKGLGVEFGGMLGEISSNPKTPILLLISSFVICLFFNNAIVKMEKFKPNIFLCIVIAFGLYLSILHLNKESAFLYFNF